MINSRSLDELTPEVKAMCEKFIQACAAVGIDILITSTYRDKESQQALYNQGRTKAGKVVTNAKPGYSYHNYRVAFDFVPIVNGKPQWGDDKLFHRCGAIAAKIGLEWAGIWKTFPELAHCQFTNGKRITDYLKEN